MKVSAQALKTISAGIARTIPAAGQVGALGQIAQKTLAKISVEVLGYDFIGLGQKLLIFYAAAFLIIKYFEAVIFGSGVMKTFAGLVGINLTPALPQSVTNFFQNGLVIQKGDPAKGTADLALTPWNVVNILVFFLLIAEFTQYMKSVKESGKKQSWITIGVWALVIGGIGLIAILPIIQKFTRKSITSAQLLQTFGQPANSTMNFAITILDPKSGQQTQFVMTPNQVVSIPNTFYVTAGPVLSSNAPTLTDAQFQSLFGAPVTSSGSPSYTNPPPGA